MIRVAGHFGELLQGRLGPQGPVVLITLPCAALGVTATLTPAAAFSLTAESANILPLARAKALLQTLTLPLTGSVTLTAEMPPGGGAGVSTASLVALARLAGWQGDPQALARACVATEGASDPLMLDRPAQLLWASRRAEILDTLPPPPAMEVIGGFFGAPERTDPADDNFPEVTDLLPLWREACAAQDLAAAARIAATSASRCLAHRRAQTDPTASLAADLGALGHVIAHTGAARGLIFAPGQLPPEARARLEQAGMTGVVQFRAGGGR